MWLNIDKPTEKVTLHEDQCSFIPACDSNFKKINKLGRDGGWFKFTNREEALRFYEDNYPHLSRGYCYGCGTKKQTSKNEVEFYNKISEKDLKELRKYDSNTPWAIRDRE